MNEELEKLIDFALADGILTDKEKKVLYKKAQELGVDQDEFEMILDAKLHLVQKESLTESEEQKSQKEEVIEIKKIECPSCGAPIGFNDSKCNFCNTELKIFFDEGAALPVNLSQEDVEHNIIIKEEQFWQASLDAIEAPYSIIKGEKNYTIKDIQRDILALENGIVHKFMNEIFESLLLLPGENFVTIDALEFDAENDHSRMVIVTSLRLIIQGGFGAGFLSVPFDSFISWDYENLETSGIIGTDGKQYTQQAVIRYNLGDKEKSMKFRPPLGKLSEDLYLPVIHAKERYCQLLWMRIPYPSETSLRYLFL
jgi:hypothetical protein